LIISVKLLNAPVQMTTQLVLQFIINQSLSLLTVRRKFRYVRMLIEVKNCCIAAESNCWPNTIFNG